MKNRISIILFITTLLAVNAPQLLLTFPLINRSMLSPRIKLYAQDPSNVVQKSERETRAAFFRFGFTIKPLIAISDKDLNYYYDRGLGFFMDCFYLRLRTRHGNGMDLYCRFTYRFFWITDGRVNKETDLVYKENNLHLFSLDPGVRGIYGTYFLGQLWQLYILASPRFLYYWASLRENKYGDGDSSHHLGSIGITIGGGIEVTITEDIGVFAEVNIGYTPVGNPKRNVDGQQVFFGVTWRTFVRRY